MAGTTDLAAVWTATTDELADEIISAQQRAYLRLTRLRAIVEDTVLLSVPDAFTRDVIESRLRPAITEALTRRLGRPVQVAVTVRVPEDGRATGTVYRSTPESDPMDHGPGESADRSTGPDSGRQLPLIPEQPHPGRFDGRHRRTHHPSRTIPVPLAPADRRASSVPGSASPSHRRRAQDGARRSGWASPIRVDTWTEGPPARAGTRRATATTPAFRPATNT